MQPTGGRHPRVARTPDDSANRPAWRLADARNTGAYGWGELTPQQWTLVHEKLSAFESMTWQQLKQDGGSHNVARQDLCREAQRDLEERALDDTDHVFSLRLRGKERVWGLLAGSVLRVLWWDPTHEICPSPKKHT